MSTHVRKPLHRGTNVKWKRRIKPYKDWERLDLQLKEKPVVPIEEMRRQGLLLAGGPTNKDHRLDAPFRKSSP
jgi:hypothetical protein